MKGHLALDIVNDPIRPASPFLARGTGPNHIQEEVIPMPVLPRIVVVHSLREVLIHRMRNDAIGRRLTVVLPAICTAMKRSLTRKYRLGSRRGRPTRTRGPTSYSLCSCHRCCWRKSRHRSCQGTGKKEELSWSGYTTSVRHETRYAMTIRT